MTRFHARCHMSLVEESSACDSTWRGEPEACAWTLPSARFPFADLNLFLLSSVGEVTIIAFLTSMSPISVSSSLRVALGMHRREIKTRHPQNNSFQLLLREGSHHLLLRGFGGLSGFIEQCLINCLDKQHREIICESLQRMGSVFLIYACVVFLKAQV